VYAAFQLISELNRQGKTGSVVSMICDSGDRYLETYYSDDWLNQKGFDLTRYRENLEVFYSSGTMPD
jgi:cysteine synthase A